MLLHILFLRLLTLLAAFMQYFNRFLEKFYAPALSHFHRNLTGSSNEPYPGPTSDGGLTNQFATFIAASFHYSNVTLFDNLIVIIIAFSNSSLHLSPFILNV